MIFSHMDDCVSTMVKCQCYICLILYEKLRFCQDFVPITCHENIMQVSIILHIAFSS
jgi:hypothetical protein